MFLTKEAIQDAIKEGEFSITDFKEDNLKSASYTFTLGPVDGKEQCELSPGDFFCLETKERLTLNGKYSCLFFTPSYLARQGIDVTQGSMWHKVHKRRPKTTLPCYS